MEDKNNIKKLLFSRECEEILNAIVFPTIILDTKFNIIKMNPAALKATGCSPEEAGKKKCFEVFHSAHKPPENCPVKKMLLSGGSGEVIEEVQALGGTYLVSCNPVLDEKGKVKSIIHVATDITGLKKTEQELSESREMYKGLFREMISGSAIHEIICDRKGKPIDYRFLDVNPEFEKITGLKREEIIGRTVTEVLPETERLWIEIYGKVALTGVPVTFESYHHGMKKFFHVSAFSQKKGQFSVTFNDITRLRTSDNELRKALEQTQNAILEKSGLLESARAILENREFKDAVSRIFVICAGLTGATSGYVVLLSEEGSEKETIYLEPGGLSRDVDSYLPVPVRVLAEEAYRTGRTVYHNELGSRNHLGFIPEAQRTIKNALFTPLIIRNETVGLLGLANKPEDFTDEDVRLASLFGDLAAVAFFNSKIENELKDSLKEKETLLKEIHHRVKNNMQIISSMLKLQSNYIEDKNMLKLFRESQNRVDTMALIHEKLYQSKDLAKIGFQQYLDELIANIVYSYEVESERIKISTDIPDIYFDVEAAIPCGLIINELVTNCIKHAFPEGRSGEIRISLTVQSPSPLPSPRLGRVAEETARGEGTTQSHPSQDYPPLQPLQGGDLKTSPLSTGGYKGEGVYVLTVSDNGIGFPEGLDFRNTNSLGLRLVNSLAGQLSGKIEMERDNGTTCRIIFQVKG